MSDNYYYYEPHSGHGLPHDPFKAIVGPRPIGWIASSSNEGILNLAPYSFFNAFNASPPIIGFCSSTQKDTVSNLMQNGQFTWNLVTKDLAQAMNQSCAEVAPEINEFNLAGLTAAPSLKVKVPRVGEAKVAFECLVTQIIQLQTSASQSIDSWLTLGEVIGVHISKDLLEDGIFNTAKAGIILRGGGPADYFNIGPEQLFRMSRPK
jgi:flavin reductase (DIM6/NTAB) family NADH-FMN oxidoreductase RutF